MEFKVGNSMKKQELNKHQINIAKELLLSLKVNPNKSVTYEDIAQKTNKNGKGNQSVGSSIGKISELCHKLGLPLISVMVYSKNEGSPAEGFYTLYKRLTDNPDHLAEKDVIKIERKRVAECGNWQILADYLGLDIDMSDYSDENLYPDEIDTKTKHYTEGAKSKIVVNQYERNPQARRKCIEKLGSKCLICGFDFEKVYGKNFKGKIHVHHIKQLSQINEKYELNPETDLIPVCPNCHMILHSKGNNEVFTPEQVKMFIELAKNQ
jgi:hypothetical protein